MKTDTLHRVRALNAMVAAATLAVACGGGSDEAAAPPPVAGPPPAPATVAITGKAVDGALQGATACYDLNDNNACDSGEPASAATAADGSYTIDVATAAAGQHRVVVRVPVGAIDAESGAVTQAFVMVAPATGTAGAQSVFVSPLTTLVQQQMTSTGQSRTAAAAFIQQQAGLAVSPLVDFTASNSADNRVAANAARVTLMAQQQQTAALAAAVGQNDLSGAPMTQGDIDKAVVQAVTGALPAIGAVASNPALVGKTGTDLQTALTAAAGTVVTSIDLTVEELKVNVGIGKLPADTAATTPEAGAALAGLQYSNATNWFMRVNQSSALDNTPDANGLLSFYDVRTRMAPYAFQPTVGVAESFANGTLKDRAGDLHWNGTAWVACFLGQRNTSTPRDALGRSSYNGCDNFNKGVTTRAAVDIAGLSMAAVVTEKILPVVGPGTIQATGSNGWSLDTALLGTDTFPAGSRLFLQTDVGTETAPGYDVRATNQVTVFSQAVADGGDARLGTVACQNSGTAVTTATLEEMVARYPGKPCVFGTQTNADGTSLNPSEAWGLSSLSMGDVPGYYTSLPAGTGNYYNNVGRMRVAFTGTGTGNGTVYYQCLVRRLDNSTRNCTAIGSGTYSVATLGDARVLNFGNLPAAFQRLTSTRVYVERGGKVYFGYRSPVGVGFNNVRLNLTGARALLAKLGLPGILPADTPKPLTGAKAATMATAKGVWGGSDGTSALVIRFGDNGEFVLAEVDPASGNGRPGYEHGWFDLDPATQTNGRLIATDTNGDWGLSHPQANEGIASITDTVLTTKGGETFSRLADGGTGIVGMWALGSATDLKVTQFVFFANGKVLSVHPAETQGACATNRQGPPGIEWSDYSFNATTGALRIFNKIHDTSGCTGAFDSGTGNTEVNLVLTIAADGKTATFLDDDGVTVLTFHRIATNP